MVHRDEETIDLFPEGVRIETNGRTASVVDIASGKEIRYIAAISVDLDANRFPRLSTSLKIDVPKVEFVGPVTDAIVRVWLVGQEEPVIHRASRSDETD